MLAYLKGPSLLLTESPKLLSLGPLVLLLSPWVSSEFPYLPFVFNWPPSGEPYLSNWFLSPLAFTNGVLLTAAIIVVHDQQHTSMRDFSWGIWKDLADVGNVAGWLKKLFIKVA